MTRLYIAGPMSGLPQFNFPAFHAAAIALRAAGYAIISPAETDPDDVKAVALNSKDGSYDANGKVGGETWGDMLARDVKMLADGVLAERKFSHEDSHGGEHYTETREPIDGICFLPGWEKSKGARLEAFVGILTGKVFFEYDAATETAISRKTEWVQDGLITPWLDARRTENARRAAEHRRRIAGV